MINSLEIKHIIGTFDSPRPNKLYIHNIIDDVEHKWCCCDIHNCWVVLSEFNSDKSKKDRLASRCKYHTTKNSHTYYLNNKDKFYEYNLKWKENHLEHWKAYSVKYGKDHLQEKNEYNREWRKNNNAHYTNYMSVYEANRKIDLDRIEYRKTYIKEYRKIPKNKLKESIRRRINKFIKLSDFTLTDRDNCYLKYLGCDIDYYKVFLEDQFSDDINWVNYGGYWHIDHIIPLSYFDLDDEHQRYVAFNYKNTRPLLAIDNIKKQNKFNLNEINIVKSRGLLIEFEFDFDVDIDINNKS